MTEAGRYLTAGGRPSKAKGETQCRTCGQIVGVVRTPWNRSSGWQEMPKTTGHKWRGVRCPGSMLSVEPSTVCEVV